MKQLKQNGFTVIEFVLIVVVVAVLAGVGYVVYQKRQTANENSKTDYQNTTEITKSEENLQDEGEDLNNDLAKDTAKLNDITQEAQ